MGYVTTRRPFGSAPLSDSEAAALVTSKGEQREDNITYNNYVPSEAELAAFYAAKHTATQTTVQYNPKNAFVTGLTKLGFRSTDNIIQWASHKWGIPTNWLRAEYVQESKWHQLKGSNEGKGDPSNVAGKTSGGASFYSLEPATAKEALV